MEHSLHYELKRFYAGPASSLEVVIDGYRVDAVTHGWLVEIQQGPLWAIRRKTQALLKKHRVLIVKPLVITKEIARLDDPHGSVVSFRKSPKRGQVYDIFEDLVHFTKVFPHPGLRIDVALVDVVEYRYPRRRFARRGVPYQLADRQLVRLRETITLLTPGDLRLLIPHLPESFDTATLSELMAIPRWRAQQVAYCLRETGAVRVVGRTKQGLRYTWAADERSDHDSLSLLVA